MNTMVPLAPRVAVGPLRVLAIGRISTEHQDLESIDAGHRDVRDLLARVYRGELHVKALGGRGSGMRTDRESIVEAEEEIATGTWDVVMAPDLARIYRNPRHLYAFVQDAVDQGTRVITLGDNFDTADANWHMAMGVAAIQHGSTIPDTQRRVRSKARDQFKKGKMVQKVRYGYRKLTEAEAAAGPGPAGLLIARIPGCTPVIREMMRRVLAGEHYETIAEWLNDEGVRPGPYAKGAWTGRLVTSLLRDPILAGTRTFGDWLSTTIYKTGKKRRRKNPDGPETEHHPELAHVTEAEQAGLIAFMDANSGAKPRAPGAAHPLFNKPRDRVAWPAQHPRCAACGELMYRYNADDLKCRGCLPCGKAARAGSGSGSAPGCWNHVQVDCREVRKRVLAALIAHCGPVPGFREALVDAAWRQLESESRRSDRAGRSAEEEVAELEKRSKLLAKAIAKGGAMEALLGELAEVGAGLEAARRRAADLQSASSVPKYASREEVSRCLESALAAVAATSHEFATLMRRAIPEFTIVPVQALDSGLVRPRGKLVLRLSALLEDGKAAAGAAATPRAGDVELTVDLFEPPAHIRAIGPSLVALRSTPRPSLTRIAAATGINRMTVKRALAYSELMASEGLEDPYRVLSSAPESASRWRRRDPA